MRLNEVINGRKGRSQMLNFHLSLDLVRAARRASLARYGRPQH